MRMWLFLAGLNGALAVALGAVAAHVLAGDERAAMLVERGAHYHLVHAAAMLGVAVLSLLGRRSKRLRAAAWLFLAGMVLFSGSLYAAAFAGTSTRLAPVGGIAYISGWLMLAAASFRGTGANDHQR